MDDSGFGPVKLTLPKPLLQDPEGMTCFCLFQLNLNFQHHQQLNTLATSIGIQSKK